MPPAAQKKKRKSKEETNDELEEWKKSKQLLKPKDQLELADAELKEPIARVLVTQNPQAPDSLVEYDFVSGTFQLKPLPPQTIVVYESKGTYLHKDTPEGRAQLIEQGVDPSTFEETEGISEISEDTQQEAEAKSVEEKPEEGEEEEGGEDEPTKTDGDEAGGDDEVSKGDEGDEGAAPKGKPRKLTNQFNFCERAALTYNNPTRSQETQTVPPPKGDFSALVLQWIIYDAYQQDWAAQQLEKELERERKEKEKTPITKLKVVAKKKIAGKAQLSEAVQGRVLECWRVLERMINQNTFLDIAKDFRYWEDPSDEYREDEGTLLPLWKFSYERTKRHTVTDLLWNPLYYDLFICCYGFLDFMKPIPRGYMCLYTLKNPSFPETICPIDSAVMCVDIHPRLPYMMVLGLYDGNVCVYNMQANNKEPQYRSNNVTNKHRGIVWEVKWVPDLPDGEMNFYSVAGDGKINNWVLMQNDLSVTTIIQLYMQTEVIGPDGTKLKVRDSATCVKFHPKDPTVYLLGTEEGKIHKCSTAYSAMYLLTYNAHYLPVYRIDFNRYNSDIFLSCSSDWRIKIWEDNRLEPLFAFDVGSVVGDVKWAPYSSTVFAACTNDAKVYVFDLNVNKYKPICIQAIVNKKRNKCTRLAFNWKLPIIIVGDDKGCIQTLKLSPNLRIPCKPPKKQQWLDQWTLQCMKLDKLLALVREPNQLTLPQDTAGTEES